MRFALIALLLLAACSSSDEDALNASAEPVDVLYNRARDALAEGEYKTAVENFEEVERQYPYSEWAVRAQLMAAYSHYRNQAFDDALPILERFVKMHPSHTSAPYAYYLSALSYYEQITDVGRDQKMTAQAMQALTEVIKRFPDSDYARDAKIKMDLVQDHLAGKEMSVGRYYLGRLEYLAAINRFKAVIDKYETTSHAPEALHRLVECYLKLGVTDEAKKYAAVLGENYPASPWYKDSYAFMKGEPAPGKPGLLRSMKRALAPTF